MKEKFIIGGGIPLKGNVSVAGAKNAAVAVLPAVILAEDVCVIENIPKINDVMILLRILKDLGATVELLPDDTVRIDSRGINTSEASSNLVKHMRASYYLLGALLCRFGHAKVSMPGGCNIGERPIDLHLKGLKQLGAKIDEENVLEVEVTADKLVGADIFFDKVSVGATINLMLAATRAQGTTTLVNAAKEPHVVDVANFLNCMGAKIKGAGTDVIKIHGVKKMHGCNYSIIPDQIEAGTIMIAAAATNGDVTVENLIPTHMEAVTAKLLEAGARVVEGEDSIRVVGMDRPKSVNINTQPYPGFPTDLQQPMTVMLSTAQGTSVIIENIFESRFKHIREIRRMGADVTTNGTVAVVKGVDKLYGAPVRASDLRAGAALIIAGLMAQGTTQIYNIKYIDRGYYNLEKKLTLLGANITRQEEEEFEDDVIDINSLL